MSSAIISYAHRPKRPPRKRAKAVAIEAPAIVATRMPKAERTEAPELDVGGAQAVR
jgi:hypothetical protein